jgi:hypothetical protein
VLVQIQGIRTSKLQTKVTSVVRVVMSFRKTRSLRESLCVGEKLKSDQKLHTMKSYIELYIDKHLLRMTLVLSYFAEFFTFHTRTRQLPHCMTIQNEISSTNT